MNKIQQIERDIAAYHEAIENAEGALEEAERELTEELSKYADDGFEDYPEYNKD